MGDHDIRPDVRRGADTSSNDAAFGARWHGGIARASSGCFASAAAAACRGGASMKILLISIFHPELVRGGAQQVAYELFRGLQARADTQAVFLAAIDPSQPAFYKAGACITGFDGRADEYLFLSRGYDYWWHKTCDSRLLEAYAEFLREIRPDVVHFHHFLLLGLDLLTFTRRVLPDVRIVFTLHEFLAICDANGHMLRVQDRALCTRASPVRCGQCFPNRGPEQFFLRELWVKRHFDVVDAFTTPSRFMIEHYVTWGLARDRITHVTNGQPDYAAGTTVAAVPTPPLAQTKRNRFGFFGQLVDNKGVWLLLEAAALLRAEGFTDFVIDINGENLRYASETRRAEIEAFRAAEEKLPPADRVVRFNGGYEVGQLAARMGRVDWCVVPSVWWETFALVISEAWMFGRPVIASNIGAMAERVRDGVDGLQFGAGDARSLAAVLRRAATEEGLWERLHAGIEAPARAEVMVDGMMGVYDGRVSRHSAGIAVA
jgi:glycosyltransferase involved in cell wall biosynthesis